MPLAVVSLVVLLAPPAGCSKQKKEKIRPPAVAGGFYPANPDQLAKMVDGFLAKAKPPAIENPIIAVVAPHAGYMYSGQVAAYSYAILKGKPFQRVVIIAPSHYEYFNFASIYDGDAYQTPLGLVPVDKAFAKKLARAGFDIRLSNRGHRVTRRYREHSIEVQLPFLQRVLGQFKIVPIIMGEQRYETCRNLGLGLAHLIQKDPKTPTLIVASSDLSHYHTYKKAEELDHKVLTAITEWDYLSMAQNFQTRVWEACGGGPIIAAMIAAERLGATKAKVLQYANTGDVTGDHSRVVGYSSVVMIKAPGKRSGVEPHIELSRPEEALLMAIARKSVETMVKQHRMYPCTDGGFHALDQERGAFVTLKKHGHLRGCIGYVAPIKPLYITVRDVAAYAATQDPRFPPVAPRELQDLQYEISVLSPLRRVLDIKQIQVGKHGLVIRDRSHEGLLLPQVPVEEGWDRMTFLRQTCLKAGLPPSAWRDRGTDIFYFTALVFNERDLRSRLPVPRPSDAMRIWPQWPPPRG